MAFSYVYYVGDGSTDTFAIPFPYLDEDHVHVYVNGEEVEIELPTAGTVRVVSGPPSAGANVKVQRHTPKIRDIDFQNASIAEEASFDRDANRLTYVTQEASDDAQAAIDAANNAEDTLNQAKVASEEAAASAVDASDFAAAAAQSAVNAQNALSSVQGRLSTAEEDIDNLEGRMDDAESTLLSHTSLIGGKVDQGDFDLLSGEVTSQGDSISSLQGKVTALENRVVTLSGIETGIEVAAEYGQTFEITHSAFTWGMLPRLFVKRGNEDNIPYMYPANGKVPTPSGSPLDATILDVTDSGFKVTVDNSDNTSWAVEIHWKRSGVLA